MYDCDFTSPTPMVQREIDRAQTKAQPAMLVLMVITPVLRSRRASITCRRGNHRRLGFVKRPSHSAP